MINRKLHIILFRLASSLSSSMTMNKVDSTLFKVIELDRLDATMTLNDLELLGISRDFADFGANNG